LTAPSGDNFLAALQNAVRENPVPAALIGMGSVWMFMGGGNVSLFGGSGRKSLFGTAAQGAQQVTGAVRQAGALGAHHIGQAAQAMAEPAWQAGTAAAATLGDAASRTAARATDAVSSGYQTTAETASQTAETISNAATAAARTLHETTANWGGGVQRNLADLLDRQPLMLGAIGLAIGAGIAASLPITDTEKRVMGDASASVRNKVSEKAADLTGQVKEIADAALDEARNQGITPKTVGENSSGGGKQDQP
jgi:hypothetical protein